MITDDRFINLDVRHKENLVYAAMLGSYSVYDSVYTETITNVGNGYGGFLGLRNTFKYKVADSLLYIYGLNNTYSGVWKRVK